MEIWTGSRIAMLRKQLGWPQTRMADALGVHPITLAKWESADTDLPISGLQVALLEKLSERRDGDALAALLLAGGVIALLAALFSSKKRK